MPYWNALYLGLAVLAAALLARRFRVMPFLILALVTTFYGLAQGEDIHWAAKEFSQGFGQTLAASGLAVLAALLLAGLAEQAGAQAWWARRLGSPGRRLGGTMLMGLLAGLGGHPVSALAVLAPLLRTAGAWKTRLGLGAVHAVTAGHGCLVPSPLIIAALAILNGDWRLALLAGLPVAAVQMGVGWHLARHAPLTEAPEPKTAETTGSARRGWGLLVVVMALIALLIAQSLGQIPSEPLGGGTPREMALGMGRPLILLWVALGLGFALLGGFGRRALAEDGPLAAATAAAVPVMLAVGAAGGFQLMLHNNGMAELVAERFLDLAGGVAPSLALAVVFLTALINRTLQGQPLAAAITVAGMMQPLVQPLGLGGDGGRALTAVAIGAGVMAIPHVNDGTFWLGSHLSGLGAHQGLKRITGGSLLQGAAALAVLLALSALI